jgi:LEA14-like dessication related protein
MRKPINLLLLLSVAFINGCASLQGLEPPSVSIADISLQDATLLEQRYRLQLRIQNPNPLELPIDGLFYELEINDQPFAKGLSNQKVTVQRYSSALIDVEGSSNLMDILRQLAGMQRGDRKLVRYHLKGKLGLGDDSRMPFENQGEIDLPNLFLGAPAKAF